MRRFFFLVVALGLTFLFAKLVGYVVWPPNQAEAGFLFMAALLVIYTWLEVFLPDG